MNTARTEARERIIRRQHFFAALGVLLIGSPTLTIVYYTTGPYASPWLLYPILGLAASVIITGLRAFATLPGDFSEFALERELQRIDRQARGR